MKKCRQGAGGDGLGWVRGEWMRRLPRHSDCSVKQEMKYTFRRTSRTQVNTRIHTHTHTGRQVDMLRLHKQSDVCNVRNCYLFFEVPASVRECVSVRVCAGVCKQLYLLSAVCICNCSCSCNCNCNCNGTQHTLTHTHTVTLAAHTRAASLRFVVAFAKFTV